MSSVLVKRYVTLKVFDTELVETPVTTFIVIQEDVLIKHLRLPQVVVGRDLLSFFFGGGGLKKRMFTDVRM